MAQLRRERGFTQSDLAARLGVTQRVISYYERRANRPPAHFLSRLADLFGVSLDELVGRKGSLPKAPPRSSRLWRRLREIETLPPSDRKAILKMLEGLLARHKLRSQR